MVMQEHAIKIHIKKYILLINFHLLRDIFHNMNIQNPYGWYAFFNSPA